MQAHPTETEEVTDNWQQDEPMADQDMCPHLSATGSAGELEGDAGYHRQSSIQPLNRAKHRNCR
jgi:hypothetical protein